MALLLHFYPGFVIFSHNPPKFQADSIFTIEKKKLGDKITTLSAKTMESINTAPQLELDLK